MGATHTFRRFLYIPEPGSGPEGLRFSMRPLRLPHPQCRRSASQLLRGVLKILSHGMDIGVCAMGSEYRHNFDVPRLRGEDTDDQEATDPAQSELWQASPRGKPHDPRGTDIDPTGPCRPAAARSPLVRRLATFTTTLMAHGQAARGLHRGDSFAKSCQEDFEQK
jgi:hypothetical protein